MAERKKSGAERALDILLEGLKYFPKIVESCEYLVVGNVIVQPLGFLIGLIRGDNPFASARSYAANYLENRRAWYNRFIFGGSVFGTDEEFSSKSLLQIGTSLSPLGHLGVLSKGLELLHVGYDEAARQIVNGLGDNNLSFQEFKEYQQEDDLLKWGERAFSVAETSASLALTLATGGGAGASTLTQLTQAGRTLGVASGCAAAGALSQELMSGEDFNALRLVDNTLSGTADSLVFMGGMSALGKYYVRLRYGQSMPRTEAELKLLYTSAPDKAARLETLYKEAAKYRDLIDFADSQADLIESVNGIEKVKDLRTLAGVTLGAAVAGTDAFDLK